MESRAGQLVCVCVWFGSWGGCVRAGKYSPTQAGRGSPGVLMPWAGLRSGMLGREPRMHAGPSLLFLW